MAVIIDLDFYRKFRVVLPIRPSAFSKNKMYEDIQNTARPYRRKRKTSASLTSSRTKKS